MSEPRIVTEEWVSDLGRELAVELIEHSALRALLDTRAALLDALEEMLYAPVHQSHEQIHLSKRLLKAHSAARDLLIKSGRTA